jgi:hypothetical protein
VEERKPKVDTEDEEDNGHDGVELANVEEANKPK